MKLELFISTYVCGNVGLTSVSAMIIALCFVLVLPIAAMNLSWLNDSANEEVSFNFLPPSFSQDSHHVIKILYHHMMLPTSIDKQKSVREISTTSTHMVARQGKDRLGKSQQACMKFRDIFSSGQQSFHLTGTKDVLQTQSSMSSANIKWQLPAKIHTVVGGENSVVGEFPHVAALGSFDADGNFILQCGGTLIEHKWILTAAHCTQSSMSHLTTAQLGIVNLHEEQNANGKTVRIRRVIRHPSYKPPQLYFDIALLELDRSIEFTSSIRPACLHESFHDAPDDAWVCGWGTTEFAGRRSDILQKAHLKLLDNIWCSSKLDQSNTIPWGIVPSMICAGSPDDNWSKDTCQGDSGGPLQIAIPYHHLFSIIGITSFGASCALNESPGVYTRVSHYIPWIENIVWSDQHELDLHINQQS